jgi:hypothetical protein
MGAKRPERKESGEWAKHLRPRLKKAYWRSNRQACLQELPSLLESFDGLTDGGPEPLNDGSDRMNAILTYPRRLP